MSLPIIFPCKVTDDFMPVPHLDAPFKGSQSKHLIERDGHRARDPAGGGSNAQAPVHTDEAHTQVDGGIIEDELHTWIHIRDKGISKWEG
jgi:hypothetical protein